MAASLKFSGRPQLEAALKDLGGQIAGRLGSNAVRAGARVIAAEARRRVPVRTGELKRSIGVRLDPGLQQAGGSTRRAFVTARARHSGLVEFGTAHSAAKSYLRPAADERAGEALDKLVENLGTGIEREALKLARKHGALK